MAHLSLYRSPWWTAWILQVTFFSLTVLSCPSLCYGIKQEDWRKLWPSTHRAALPRHALTCPAGTSKASNGSNSFIRFFHKEYSRPHHESRKLSLAYGHANITPTLKLKQTSQNVNLLSLYLLSYSHPPLIPTLGKKKLHLFSLHPFSTHTSMVTAATT